MNKGDLVGAANKNVDLEKDILILFDHTVVAKSLTHITAAERERATLLCNN